MADTLTFLFLVGVIFWSIRTTLRAMRRERAQQEFDSRWHAQETLYKR